MELKKLNTFCKNIIAESRKTKNIVKQNKKKSKKVIKEEAAFVEHLQNVEVNGNEYQVNFIEFPNGTWNYQLNQKYNNDCDLNDPSCDVWYPNLNEVEFEQNFTTYDDAKNNAIQDIQNQINWGQIR